MATLPSTAKNTTSTLRFAVVCFILAVTLGLFGFITFEALAARADASNSLQSLSGNLQQGEALKESSRLADSTKDQRQTLATLPIPKNGGASFISSIEALGTTAGVGASVSSVTATPPQGHTPGTLTLVAQFSGTFAACTRFAALVETMPQSLSVSSLSLQYDDTSGTWSGTMQISALSFDTP